jgi:hypothetical protein
MNVVDKLPKQGNGVFEGAKAYFEIGASLRVFSLPIPSGRSQGNPLTAIWGNASASTSSARIEVANEDWRFL